MNYSKMKYIKLFEEILNNDYTAKASGIGPAYVKEKEDRDKKVQSDVKEICDILSLTINCNMGYKILIYPNSNRIDIADRLTINISHRPFIKIGQSIILNKNELIVAIMKKFNNYDRMSTLLTKMPYLYDILDKAQLLTYKIKDKFDYLKNELF